MDFIPNYSNKNVNNISKNQNIQNKNSSKLENDKLRKENLELKAENSLLKNEILTLKNQLYKEKENSNKFITEINNLKLKLINKTNEINKLIKENKNKNFISYFNNEEIKRGEIITIQFKSIDQKVDIAFSCKSTDIFVRIEEMLYNQYPELKDYNTYFTVNGRVLKRFKTIQENNIRNFDKILLNLYE